MNFLKTASLSTENSDSRFISMLPSKVFSLNVMVVRAGSARTRNLNAAGARGFQPDTSQYSSRLSISPAKRIKLASCASTAFLSAMRALSSISTMCALSGWSISMLLRLSCGAFSPPWCAFLLHLQHRGIVIRWRLVAQKLDAGRSQA